MPTEGPYNPSETAEKPEELGVHPTPGRPEKHHYLTDEISRLAACRDIDDMQARPRDLEGLISFIRQNRTSHISKDGHRVAIADDDNSLGEFSEAWVKRNNETGNPPQGLACNVTLFRKTGKPFYCRIGVDGTLVLRFMEDNNEVAQLDRKVLVFNKSHAVAISKSWMKNPKMNQYMARMRDAKTGITTAFKLKPDSSYTITIVDKDDRVIAEIDPTVLMSGGFEAVFDELHYLALKALQVVYVKKEAEDKDKSVPLVSVTKTQDPTSQPAPEAVLAPGFPVTVEREEHTMKIDLTDEEKRFHSNRARTDRIRIISNRARALEVFGALRNGKELPEQPPSDIENLVLHRRVRIRGEYYYAACADPKEAYRQVRDGVLKTGDLFLRTGRAFSQPLPYVVGKRYAGDDPASAPYYTVKKKNLREKETELRMRSFAEREAGESLDIGKDRPKILYFDVSDKPFNRTLFERVRGNADIEAILKVIRARITEELDEKRRRTRAEFLEGEKGADVIAYMEAMNRHEAEARSRMKSEESMAVEMASHAVEITKKENKILRLPQGGFMFDQTFNQGRFQSLEDLLKSL
jgi:hypothetical protein